MQYQIKITFTEPILGTAPQDKDIYSNYILEANANGDDTFSELETVRDEKGRTGFHKLEDGSPIIYDYMLKGFFKDACGMQTRIDGSLSKKIKAYKRDHRWPGVRVPPPYSATTVWPHHRFGAPIAGTDGTGRARSVGSVGYGPGRYVNSVHD